MPLFFNWLLYNQWRTKHSRKPFHLDSDGPPNIQLTIGKAECNLPTWVTQPKLIPFNISDPKKKKKCQENHPVVSASNVQNFKLYSNTYILLPHYLDQVMFCRPQALSGYFVNLTSLVPTKFTKSSYFTIN